MKPAAFDYARPETTAEALDLLARHGDEARILAGGQSLGPMLNMRLAAPSLLIDISRIESLRTIAIKNGMVEVGAAVTQDELLTWPDLSAVQPLLAQTLPWVGHHQTRQRGTVCGSIANSDPSAELPLAFAVLDGQAVLEGKRGRRTVAADAFQTGIMATAIESGEMLTAVRFPVARPGTAAAFREVSQRHGDFAMVALAAVGGADGVRIGVGGVAETPAVSDLPWLADGALEEALNDFAWSLGATGDQHATARYRRELVRRIGRRVIAEVSDAKP